ncbi:MAG: protein-L-isoaspartate(D-aspartate) O-methyltransferase [Conexivisphaerales archaeon]
MNLTFEQRRRLLVNMLKEQKIIISSRVERAMLKVPREEFVWQGYAERAYDDSPLPLGDTGQTISAPHMVALMLEEMELQQEHSVLEIGTGSGYNIALIAEIVGNSARVITVELDSRLAVFAKNNLQKTGYSDCVEVVNADGSAGLPAGIARQAYDRIAVTAACSVLPGILKSQLKRNGILLAPVGGPFAQRLVKVRKDEESRLTETSITWVSFVPLKQSYRYWN